jgi:hypothetical protein
MKPTQKIELSCRQTADGIGRLMSWLEVNRARTGLAHRALIDELEAAVSGLDLIAAAAPMPPGIGIAGTADAGKLDVLLQLVAIRGSAPPGEFGQRPLDVDTLRRLLPSEAGSGGAAIIRLSAAELPPTPRGFPVRIGLLSEIDVVEILASAHLAAATSPPLPPTPAAFERLFSEATVGMSLQTVPGVCERDICELEEALVRAWGAHPLLSGLAAIGYFARVREVVAHLSASGRRMLFSVLWGGSAAVGAVATRLVDAIERLGHGADAYCSSEALLAKDKSTGWSTRHPRSIVDAATVMALSATPGPMLSVMNRFGQAVDIERAVLAAIVAELPLHVAQSRLSDLAPAEVLDLPVVPPALPVAPERGAAWRGFDRGLGSVAAGGGDPFAIAVARYARQKAIHLTVRATRRRELTSLVVVVDPMSHDDSLAPALAEWIETTQGATPWQRARVDRGLFFATLSSLDRQGRDGRFGRRAGGDDPTADTLAEEVQAAIRDVLAAGQTWSTNWTDGQPVRDVTVVVRGGLAVRSPIDAAMGPAASSTSSSAAGPVGDVPSSGIGLGAAASLVPRLAGFGARALALATRSAPAAPPDLRLLVQRLSATATARNRNLELSRAISDIRRRLRGTIARHHQSSDPAAVAEWRRSTAIEVANRLQTIASVGRLGHLQRGLLPDERATIAAIAKVDQIAMAHAKDRRGYPIAPAASVALHSNGPNADMPPGSIAATAAAEAAVAHWLVELRRKARSAAFARSIGLDMPTLAHLVSELAAGAVRVDLAGEIARAYRMSADARRLPALASGDGMHRSLGLEPAADDRIDAVRMAAYSCRITAAYLEVLGDVACRGADARSRSLEVDIAATPYAGYPAIGLRPPGGGASKRQDHGGGLGTFLQDSG